MKTIGLAILFLIAVAVAWKAGVFESPAAKSYRAHRQRLVERDGFRKDVTAQRKWSLKIDECRVAGASADVRATQKTATIPENAASFVFATIVTRRYQARLERKGGAWIVVEENELSKEISTYEDRRN